MNGRNFGELPFLGSRMNSGPPLPDRGSFSDFGYGGDPRARSIASSSARTLAPLSTS